MLRKKDKKTEGAANNAEVKKKRNPIGFGGITSMMRMFGIGKKQVEEIEKVGNKILNIIINTYKTVKLNTETLDDLRNQIDELKRIVEVLEGIDEVDIGE